VIILIVAICFTVYFLFVGMIGAAVGSALVAVLAGLFLAGVS